MAVINPNEQRKCELIAQRKAAIEAAKASDAKIEISKPLPEVGSVENKIRIIFDNSGSMGGKKIIEAKQGTVEFFRNCNPYKDAVAIHLLDDTSATYNKQLPTSILHNTLSNKFIDLANDIDSDTIGATGSTPLFATIKSALFSTPKANRLVAFSDGSPDFDDMDLKDSVIASAIESKIPIDTVYFGVAKTSPADLMEEIANRTGGIFLVFDPAKGVSFANAFKYLSPGKRLMLMSEEFKKSLQNGSVR